MATTKNLPTTKPIDKRILDIVAWQKNTFETLKIETMNKISPEPSQDIETPLKTPNQNVSVGRELEEPISSINSAPQQSTVVVCKRKKMETKILCKRIRKWLNKKAGRPTSPGLSLTNIGNSTTTFSQEHIPPSTSASMTEVQLRPSIIDGLNVEYKAELPLETPNHDVGVGRELEEPILSINSAPQQSTVVVHKRKKKETKILCKRFRKWLNKKAGRLTSPGLSLTNVGNSTTTFSQEHDIDVERELEFILSILVNSAPQKSKVVVNAKKNKKRKKPCKKLCKQSQRLKEKLASTHISPKFSSKNIEHSATTFFQEHIPPSTSTSMAEIQLRPTIIDGLNVEYKAEIPLETPNHDVGVGRELEEPISSINSAPQQSTVVVHAKTKKKCKKPCKRAQRLKENLASTHISPEFSLKNIGHSAATFSQADIPPSTTASMAEIKLRPIIIDGLNIGYNHGDQKTFSVKGICLCIESFYRRGHRNITAFIPQHLQNGPCSQSKKVLTMLTRLGFICLTPSRKIKNIRITCDDDRIMLDFAHRCGGVIVSNDIYEHLYEESYTYKDVIENRQVMFTFVQNKIIVPEVQYNQRSLSDILRFPS